MFLELNLDQRRTMINAQQLFNAYRDARAALLRDYRGSMRWRMIGSAEYLAHKADGIETSLGKRSPELEARAQAFIEGRAKARARRDSLSARLAQMRPINAAYQLGRVPELSARIIDAIDRAGLFDGRVRIAGTTALYAYEANTGVRFESGLVATDDLDLLLDPNKERYESS